MEPFAQSLQGPMEVALGSEASAEILKLKTKARAFWDGEEVKS